MSRPTVRLQILCVTLVLLPTLLQSGCVPNKKFSVQRWKQSKPKDRQWMADDFLRSFNTTGIHLDELKLMLGEPDYPLTSVIYYLDSEVTAPTTPLEIWSARPVMRVFLHEGVVTNVGLPDSAAGLRQPFDAVKWKTSPPSERLTMCTSLLNDVTLNGMPADEVETLLGRADEQEVNYDLGVRMVTPLTLTFIIDRNLNIICAQTIER